MSTVRLYASESCIVKNTTPAFKDTTSASIKNSSSPSVSSENIAMLFKVNLPDEYKFKEIYGGYIAVYHSSRMTAGTTASILPCFSYLREAYDENTATFGVDRSADKYDLDEELNFGGSYPTTKSGYALSGGIADSFVEYALTNGLYFYLGKYSWKPENIETTFYTSRSGNKPYIDVDFGETKAKLIPSEPTAGKYYVNRYKACTITWSTRRNIFHYIGDLYTGTAELQYRDGEAGTINSISAGNVRNTSVMVPANTFPRTSDLQMRVKVVDGGGTTTYSDWKSFSTNIRLTPSDLSPASGYVDESKANTFAWHLNATADYEFTALTESASVQIQWRASSSGSTNTINASSLYSHTIPANTFPGTGSPQWRVKVTDSYGNVEYSDWKTITTTDSQGTATPIAPVNSIVSGGAGTVFRWLYSSATGSAPSGATIQSSTDGSTWTNLKTITGTTTETTIDLSSYAGGQFFWRVRANNNDGVAGPWSNPVSFILLKPPSAPSVSATQTPRPDVSWQAPGQQAYQIIVDGIYDSGKVFGTAKNAKLPIILPDGQQLVKVRVQNSLGLWSEYGTAPVNVHNTPGTTITLSAKIESFAAVLTWNGTADRYLVYRDNESIGLTTEATYTDYMIVGTASYHVVGIDDSTDMYTVSNTAKARLCLSTPVIADSAAPVWLDLRLSENNYREIQISKSRAVTYRHYTGAKYPVAESSNEYELSIGFDAAFLCKGEADALENLIGTRVIFKAKSGAYVGILAAQRTTGTFYDTFQCQIQTVDNTEEVLL